MADFTYKALDSHGQFVSGELQAASSAMASRQLIELGYTPLSTQQVRGSSTTLWATLTKSRVAKRDVTVLLQDLALLLRSGLPLDEGLRLLTENTNAATMNLVTRLRSAIGNGANFADALQSHPATNIPELIAVVRSAEAAGNLENALEQVAQERQKQEQINARIQAALRYPIFLLIVSAAILLFFLLFVVPQFADVVRDFGAQQGSMVSIVLAISTGLREQGEIIAAILAIACVGILLLWRVEAFRRSVSGVVERAPVVSGVLALRRTALFCRSLGILLANGVNLTDALRLMSESGLGDTRMALISDLVRRGGRLVDALAETDLIQPLAIRMLRVGEESGSLASVASRCASYYEAKLTAQIDKLTGIIGPAAIVFISVVIGTLIVSIMSTLLSINQLAM